jgi:hypothetical protein
VARAAADAQGAGWETPLAMLTGAALVLAGIEVLFR